MHKNNTLNIGCCYRVLFYCFDVVFFILFTDATTTTTTLPTSTNRIEMQKKNSKSYTSAVNTV